MQVTRSTSSDLLWLTEEDVRELVTLNDAIEALAEGLVLEASGHAKNVDKALGTWDASSMHALGSMMPQAGYVAFKTWANTPRGAAAVVSLFSATDGRLLALIEAAALGSMRTAAISGLATRHLAAPAADEMSLIGTGVQAMMQVAAIAATRPLRRLRVFSPTPEKRAAFVLRARASFDFEVMDTADVAAAVRDSPIITLVTRARTPFLASAMVARGAHINAPGAILPGNAEFEQNLFERADLVVVDSISAAQKNSREFIDHYGNHPPAWAEVKTLSEILQANLRRPHDADITLFKPMGMGLSDLSVTTLVYQRAAARGVGTRLPRGKRDTPVWIPATAPVALHENAAKRCSPS
ncbi:MAG TPA: ornithine cyclodeaminase family protein [Steroidobacteraceae bacterium]|nr:ornithine cyclodeaminase family protein [Steroidobacteraceae bacterium]